MTDNDHITWPACGLSVPPHRAKDIHTPAGPITMCNACHPDVGVLSDTEERVVGVGSEP